MGPILNNETKKKVEKSIHKENGHIPRENSKLVGRIARERENSMVNADDRIAHDNRIALDKNERKKRNIYSVMLAWREKLIE